MAACPNCGRQTLRTKDWACQWCGYPLISRAYKPIEKTFKELQEERAMAAASAGDEEDEAEESEFAAYDTEEEAEPEPPKRGKPETPKRGKPEPPPQEPPKPKFRFFRKQEPTQPRPAPEPRPEDQDEDEDTVEQLPPRYTAPPPPPRPVYRPEPKPEPPPQQRPAYTPPPVPAPLPRNEVLPQPVPKAEPPAVPMQPIINIPPVPPQQTPPPPVVQTPPPPVVAQTPPASTPPAGAPPAVTAKPEIVIEPSTPYVPSLKADDIREGMEIPADDLDALFKADKAGINAKLTGKTIVLKGVVEKVFIREHLDIRYIMVTGKKKLVWSSRCTFNKEDSGKASRLNEGAEVAVRGKYDGYGKNVIFKDCQVI
jgi:hypothetical protein